MRIVSTYGTYNVNTIVHHNRQTMNDHWCYSVGMHFQFFDVCNAYESNVYMCKVECTDFRSLLHLESIFQVPSRFEKMVPQK